MLSRLMVVLLLAVPVIGSDKKIDSAFEANGKQLAKMFTADGKPFSKVQQKTKNPKIVIDTVQIKAGWGTMTLNEQFSESKHNVTPTSINDIRATITLIADDSASLGSATMRTFGYTLSSNKNRLIVRSSVTNDTVRAVITAYIK